MTQSPAYNPSTMFPYEDIIPPNGQRIYFFFNLTKLGHNSPTFPVVSMNYQTDVNTPEMQGTLTMPLDDDLYKNINVWDEFDLYWGYGGNTPPSNPIAVFNGYVKDVKRSALDLVVTFWDKGVLLLKNDILTYTNQYKSDIVKDIITKAGLTPYINWARTSYDTIVPYYNSASNSPSSSGSTTGSYSSSTGVTDNSSSTDNSSTDTSSSGYVTGAGTIAGSLDGTKRDNNGELLVYGRWYQTTVANHCPVCGLDGKIVWVHGKMQHYCKPGDWTDGGMYKCCVKLGGCDSDWSIMGQNQKSTTDIPSRDLPIVSGPTRVNAPIDFSNSGNSTDSGNVVLSNNAATMGKSYWQMLIDVITLATDYLMIYVYMDTCYVVPVTSSVNPLDYIDNNGKLQALNMQTLSPNSYEIFVDDRVNVEKGTVTVTDPKPGMTNQIIVNYGNKASHQQVIVGEQAFIDKFGKKTQPYNMYNLNQIEALAYAENMLKKTVRDNGFSIDLTAIGVPFFMEGMWCRTILTRYNINDTYFISKVNLKWDNQKAARADLTLNEFYPDISIANADSTQSDIASLSETSNASIDQIGYAEAKFRDCQPEACGPQTSTPTANDKYGYSDCWGDSYWLFNKLKAIGVKVRIVCCNTGEHRWIQINTNGSWQNWNYQKYNSQHHGSEACSGSTYHVLPGYST